MITRNVDITGLDKAEVLAALYNHSKIPGMGFFGQRKLGERAGKPMTKEWAREEMEANMTSGIPGVVVQRHNPLFFDYLYGKVIKVNLSKDEFDPGWYDYHNGKGAAAFAISQLRQPTPEGEQVMQAKLAQVNEDLKQDPDELNAKVKRNLGVTFLTRRTAPAAPKADERQDSGDFCGFKPGFLNRK